MKKSVIILIGIIYVASIFIVGFFGIKITSYNEIIYITDIECTNKNAEIVNNNKDEKKIKFKFKEGGDIMENSILLQYNVFPENSTLRGNKAVEIVYDEKTTAAKVDGVKVSFLRKGALTVQLKSKDGSNIIETVKLIAY